MILFGHPTGNPNSHQAALGHYEAGRLEAFCVPWMPTAKELRVLSNVPGMKAWASRLERRSFVRLLSAPLVQGRLGEWKRMAKRVFLNASGNSEALAYEANDWLMRTMKRGCRRGGVTAIHAYEDCSLWQFEEAKRLGKACIYDMPIGYYPAWEQTQAELVKKFSDWLPPGGLSSSRFVRPEQKRREMELGDLVLAPSTFVKETILRFHPDKKVVIAPYGVDLEFWRPNAEMLKTETLKPESGEPTSDFRPLASGLRFIYAGQCSIRKGTPILLEAWRKADLKDAQLELVGPWQLVSERLKNLPADVTFTGPVSLAELRDRYQAADVLVFPSFFEGFGLVILEAMGCGLPVVATEATAGPDILDEKSGKVIPSGSVDALVEVLRWFSENRNRLPEMSRAARAKAELCTWANYRQCVSSAVASFI
jgi:starch synthase